MHEAGYSQLVLCYNQEEWDRGEEWDGGEGWEGGSGMREHVYTYSLFTLLYGRNQHNMVKQLSTNREKKVLHP